MTSPAKKIWNYITNKPLTKDRVLTHINPDNERELKFKEMSKALSSRDAQLSQISAKERLKKTEEDELRDEIKLIKQAKQKEEEMEAKKYDIYLFHDIYKRLQKNKKLNIEITDKDDKVVFDDFKGIGINTVDGKLVVMGKSGNVWAEGNSLREIIHKPETIKNQIRRKRILLPFDQEFNHVPELDSVEMPVMSYNEETGGLDASEEREMKVRDMLIERDVRLNRFRKDQEHHEQVIADLRSKNSDLELSKKSWKSQAESNKTNLSEALESVSDMTDKFSGLSNDLAVAQNQKTLADDIQEKYESALREILGELESEKAQTAIRKAMDRVHTDVEWAKKNIPKEIHTTVVEESKIAREPVKTGEVLG